MRCRPVKSLQRLLAKAFGVKTLQRARDTRMKGSDIRKVSKLAPRVLAISDESAVA